MSASESKRSQAEDAALPEFERPPLAEVVLALQFDPLVGMTSAHMGGVWARFRDKFPRTEDHPLLPGAFERLGGPREPGAFAPSLELVTRPPLPRCWFVSSGGEELLQLQEDRFAHNWRELDGEAAYPRYSRLRQSFEGEVRCLEEYLLQERIGELRPNQCEVTYINHILAGEGWNEHRDAARVFPMLVPQALPSSWSYPEEIRFNTSYRMIEGGEPRGRLHVSITSGFLLPMRKPMFAMTLTARGAPLGNGIPGALAFLDLGHEWIVRGFDSLTGEAMHQAWGRRGR